MPTFEHEIDVPLSVADALLLFTPKGEEAWIDHWRPNYIELSDGRIQKDMVFTTGEGEETTFWACLDWEPIEGRVRYLRLTPASRLAFVDVRCRPAANGARVRVRYQFVPLTDAGGDLVAAIGPEDFAEMIRGWGTLIAGHLDHVRAPS